jgi:hypothetical protein
MTIAMQEMEVASERRASLGRESAAVLWRARRSGQHPAPPLRPAGAF